MILNFKCFHYVFRYEINIQKVIFILIVIKKILYNQWEKQTCTKYEVNSEASYYNLLKKA